MRASLQSRNHPRRVSVALILSYVFDWVIIILMAAIGYILEQITPNKRPFSLSNPEIAFPHVKKEKISTAVLLVCVLVAPALIILLVAFLLVPGPTVPKSTPMLIIWKRKLWEWHTGWIGLALALASTFFITDGMKNLFGKPRPDLLSRCQPDLSNIAEFAVGSFLNPQTGVLLVSADICTNTDKNMMDDAFRSFPSGHSSSAAAGLIYLSLFLASKLAITIPFLSPSAYSSDRSTFTAFPSRATSRQSSSHDPQDSKSMASDGDPFKAASGQNDGIVAARNQAAAPPVYLLVLAVIPFFASIYIASTRFSDFRHHGFDILFGYFIGTVCAVFAFRYYHLPISGGAGWSWGPRSQDRSFWAGVGVGSYSNNSQKAEDTPPLHRDLETGIAGEGSSNNVGVIAQQSDSRSRK